MLQFNPKYSHKSNSVSSLSDLPTVKKNGEPASEEQSSTEKRMPIFRDARLETVFRRQGFVVVPLLSTNEIAALNAICGDYSPSTAADHFTAATETDLARRTKLQKEIRVILEPKLKKLIPGYSARLAGCNIKLAGGSKGLLPLHQDITMVDSSQHIAINAWCPLIDVNEHNGCLRVIAGSHRFRSHITASPPFNTPPFASIAGRLQSEFTTAITMRKGHALIFDQCLLHYSEPNLSGKKRIAVGCLLLPGNVATRIYSPDKDNPEQLHIYEVTDVALSTLDLIAGISEPCPDGINRVGSIEYSVKPMSVEVWEPLRPKQPTTRSRHFLTALKGFFSKTKSHP